MSNHAYDRAMAHEHYVGEVACVECGYHRNGAAHPKVKCPRTGRCGECGNEWPCQEHCTHPDQKYYGKWSEKLGDYETYCGVCNVKVTDKANVGEES